MKALCEGAGGDPDEEELSPDSACSAESQASHRDQPHDRELLSFFLLYSMWFVETFDLERTFESLKSMSTCCHAFAVDTDSLSHVSSTGSSGVEEEEDDEEESGTLLRHHFDTLAVAANGIRFFRPL